MKRTHYRFGRDIMGEPRFNGIRVDAEALHPVRGLTLENVQYRSVGGVKVTDIPQRYPGVADLRQHPGEETSENYYPDWSRMKGSRFI